LFFSIRVPSNSSARLLSFGNPSTTIAVMLGRRRSSVLFGPATRSSAPDGKERKASPRLIPKFDPEPRISRALLKADKITLTVERRQRPAFRASRSGLRPIATPSGNGRILALRSRRRRRTAPSRSGSRWWRCRGPAPVWQRGHAGAVVRRGGRGIPCRCSSAGTTRRTEVRHRAP